MVGLRKLAVGAALAALAVGALGGADSLAAAPTISLGDCSRSASQRVVVTDPGTLSLTGPTIMGTNYGSIQDFLQGATATLSVNGTPTNVNAGFSAPVAITDPVFGPVWATSWSGTVPSPGIGAPARTTLQITLLHVMPQLVAPSTDGGAGFVAGATITRTCTLDRGQPVDATGGIVTTPDHAATVTIPPGALTTATSITIDPSTATPPASLGSAVGSSYDFGPSGTQFSAPVTLALSYDPTTVPAAAVSQLHIAGLSNGVWRLLPSIVNPTTVTAQVRHFSSYVIVKATCTGFVVGGLVGNGTAAVVGVQAQEITGSISAPTATDLTDINGEYALCVPDRTTLYLRYEPPTGSAYASQWYSGATTYGASTAITLAGADVRADITLGPGTPITGVVTDRGTGLPLANAFVTIHQLTPTGSCCQFGVTLVERTTTDATGRYHAALPAGNYKLVSAPPAGTDYVTQWWQDATNPNSATTLAVPSATAAADVSFALVPGIRVRGQVTDSTTAVVPNAFVAAQGTDVNGNPSFVAGSGTDSTGSYSFVVPAGTFKIQFNPPQNTALLGQWWNNRASFGVADPLTVSATQAPPTGGVNAVLATGFVISGTLRDATSGAIIPGGNVSASLPLLPGGCCKPQFVAGTGVQANGTFFFAVPAGTYILNANPPQSSTYVPTWYGGTSDPATATPITVNATTPNAGTALNVTLQPGFVISGVVTDATTTAPIPNANVNANVPPPSGGCCPQGVGGTNTQSNGSFRFVVPAGKYILYVNAPQGSLYVSTWYGGTSDPSTATPITVGALTPNAGTNLALTLQPGFLISGVVTDATTTAPIPNANVNANLVPAPGSCCAFVGGSGTQSNGSFSFVVPAGTYILNISAPQGSTYLSQWYGGTNDPATARPITVNGTAPNAGTNLALTLQPGFLISGTVKDSSNAPIPGADININGSPIGGSCCYSAQSAADGTWSVVVTPGTYLVYVGGPKTGAAFVGQWWPNTFDPHAATVITRNASTATPANPIAVVLQPGFRVSGTVTNPSNVGVARVGVTAQDATQPCCRDVAAFGADWIGGGTDANGFWSLVVPAGSYRFSFFPNCCQPQSAGDPPYLQQYWNGKGTFETADILPVSPTQLPPTTGVNIVLALGFRISGTVTDAVTSAGVPNVGIGALDATQRCCVWLGGGNTDPNGFYTLVVPGGTSAKLQFQPRNTAGTAYLGQWYSGASSFDTATAVGGPTGGSIGTVNAQLQTGLVISGRVTGGLLPLANVWVSANLGGPNAQCCSPVSFSASTDSTGAYRLVVPAGTYRLQFNPPLGGSFLSAYYSTTNIGTQDFYLGTDLTAPQSLINITLTTGHRITGVLTAGGLPLPHANVSAWRVVQGCCNYVSGTQTLADGSYSISVPDGTYHVRYEAPRGTHFANQWNGGTADFNIAPNVVVAGADVPLATATLPTGVWISGRVFGPDGITPLANVYVSAQPSSSTCCTNSAFETNTDDTGTYHLVVLPGSYKVQLNPPYIPGTPLLWQWYSTTAPGTRDFTAGDLLTVSADSTIGNVTIQAGVAITGHVRSGGVALGNVNVGGLDPATGRWVNGSTSQADGSYYLVVPAGSYAIYFDGTFIGHGTMYYVNATTLAAATPVSGPSSGIDVSLP